MADEQAIRAALAAIAAVAADDEALQDAVHAWAVLVTDALWPE